MSLEVELNREMNRVISQFGGTGSFLISVEQGHFSFLWNRVISQLCGTGSFLNFVEQGHISFLCNMVFSQFGGVELRS